MHPFHLSFTVPDLEAARGFYLDLLGCSLGRDKKDWIDILFFGHQLTIHQENRYKAALAIDHFGPVMVKTEWTSVVAALTTAKTSFIMAPTVTNPGEDDESGKFMIADPAGNILEFKYYCRFEKTVGAV